MAKIIRNVDNILEITGKDFIIELELIEFVDDKDRVRKFKINGICPVAVEDCVRVSPDSGWDSNNFHFVIDVDANSEIP